LYRSFDPQTIEAAIFMALYFEARQKKGLDGLLTKFEVAIGERRQ
jgi:hypothetical protein